MGKEQIQSSSLWCPVVVASPPLSSSRIRGNMLLYIYIYYIYQILPTYSALIKTVLDNQPPLCDCDKKPLAITRLKKPNYMIMYFICQSFSTLSPDVLQPSTSCGSCRHTDRLPLASCLRPPRVGLSIAHSKSRGTELRL